MSTVLYWSPCIWRFAMDVHFQLVLWDDLPDPKGPLSPPILQQAVAEANKQI